MHILDSLDPLQIPQVPTALTIGNFDGVHLGHQALLQTMSRIGQSVVLTFSNHPSEVISGRSTSSLISPSHKLQLLEKHGVNVAYVLPFTHMFSQQSPQEFLTLLKQKVPFTHLILGYNAVIGHERQGNAVELRRLASLLEFHLIYLDPVIVNGTAISSTCIRQKLEEGLLKEVSHLLGRPYSVAGVIEEGLMLRTPGLCLPPSGEYEVQIKYGSTIQRGTIYLHSKSHIELFFSLNSSFQGREVELFFNE